MDHASACLVASNRKTKAVILFCVAAGDWFRPSHLQWKKTKQSSWVIFLVKCLFLQNIFWLRFDQRISWTWISNSTTNSTQVVFIETNFLIKPMYFISWTNGVISNTFLRIHLPNKILKSKPNRWVPWFNISITKTRLQPSLHGFTCLWNLCHRNF